MNNQDWKADLQHRCILAISQLPEVIAHPQQPKDFSSHPSLYQFYEELLTMRNEVRKINRKTAGTLTSFGDVLEGMQVDSTKLREHLNKESVAKGTKSALSRNTALSMVDLLDRAQRLEKASEKHREKGWRGMFQARQHEEQQQGAIFIFTDHLKKLLLDSKIEPIHVLPGDVFDPLCMKAVGELTDATNAENAISQLVVTSEILPGYRMGDQCLRPAEVYLTRQNHLQS